MVEKLPQTPHEKNSAKNILTNNTNKSLSSNLDRINIAKALPCETTENILESVFDKKESF
jgi:hypothetical protein